MKRFKKLLVHLDLEGAHDAAAVRYASAVSRLSRSQRVEFVDTGPVAPLLLGSPDDSPARAARWLAQAKAEVEALVRQRGEMANEQSDRRRAGLRRESCQRRLRRAPLGKRSPAGAGRVGGPPQLPRGTQA